MPIQSKCKQYSPSEVDLEHISNLAFEELGQRPFRWQLETTLAILTGNDVVKCYQSPWVQLPAITLSISVSAEIICHIHYITHLKRMGQGLGTWAKKASLQTFRKYYMIIIKHYKPLPICEKVTNL
jgi:hypothetical protein